MKKASIFHLPASPAVFRLVIVIAVLAFIGYLFHGAASLWEESSRTANVLEFVALTFVGLAGLLIIWAAWSSLVRLTAFLAPILAAEQVEIKTEPPKVPEQAKIEVVTGSLEETLKRIETERGDASRAANDIEFLCHELAMLAKAFVEKGEEKHRLAAQMQVAFRALANRDGLSPMEYGMSIGSIPDDDFRRMCEAKTENAQYWLNLSQKAGQYIQTLHEWGNGYMGFGARLVSEVGDYKARIATVRETVSYGMPADALLSAENSLGSVAHLLEAKGELWTIFAPEYRLPSYYRARQIIRRDQARLEAKVE